MPISFLPPKNGQFFYFKLDNLDIPNIDSGQKFIYVNIGSNLERISIWITLFA